MPGQKEPFVRGKRGMGYQLNGDKCRGEERLDCAHGVFDAA